MYIQTFIKIKFGLDKFPYKFKLFFTDYMLI